MREPKTFHHPLRPAIMGDVNAGTVLDLIRSRGEISRADVARETRLSPTAVSKIVAALLRRDLVREELAHQTQLGRRPILLRFNPNAGFAVGVDVDVDRLQVGLVNLEGKVVEIRQVDIAEDVSVADVVESIGNLTDDLTARLNSAFLVGLGLGVPSSIGYEEGILQIPALPNLREAPIQRLLQERCHTPVFVENDAKAAALAEYRLTPEQTGSNLLYVKVGEGIGAGLVLGGALYRGSRGVAGTIGHIKLPMGSQLCNCGNYGCLEAEVGGKALLRRAQEALRAGVVSKLEPGALNLAALVGAARQEDCLAVGLLTDTARALGRVLTVIERTLDLDQIILGGPLALYGIPFLQAVEAEMAAYEPAGRLSTNLVLARLGEATGVVAAASLALDAFFASPR